ncbi:DNA-binding protein [Camelimonas fluminis]|uniref:Helix-turn-helix transcriptional regulator n=1 Tax=Camelimonas fluminis TaxID=1576911 RepID=A0ABV7UPS5_9HYPH|nr:hypothetical protein [Camelimonas fluminis]GHE79429.1 DNA-binding protein [Camelimonas fluminis]
MLGAEEYGDLIGRVYEASVIPELWPAALDRLASLSGCLGGLVFVNSGKRTNWACSPVIEHSIHRMFDEGWMDRNDRLAGMLAKGTTGFVRDQDLFDDSEFEDLPMYRDLLIPEGLGWGSGTFVQTASGDTVVLTVEGRFEDGPVSQSTVQTLDALRPHLARAGVLSALLQLERVQAMLDGLEKSGAPAAVVGDGGKIVGVNGLFEGLGEQIVSRAHGKIALMDTVANRMLHAAMSSIQRDTTQDLRSVAVPKRDGLPACILHVIPVRRQARDIFARSEALLIVSHDGKALSIGASILCELYDLTRAEAAVAMDLLQGTSVSGIATAKGRSVETVRSQVKRVLAKTGCASQLDFVTRLGPLAY